jgi:hypothetical protein
MICPLSKSRLFSQILDMLAYASVHSSYPPSVPGIYFLALPNVLTAGALYGFGGHLLGQLLFADRARFGHHVCHDIASF